MPRMPWQGLGSFLTDALPLLAWARMIPASFAANVAHATRDPPQAAKIYFSFSFLSKPALVSHLWSRGICPLTDSHPSIQEIPMITAFFSHLGFITFVYGCYWFYDQVVNSTPDSKDDEWLDSIRYEAKPPYTDPSTHSSSHSYSGYRSAREDDTEYTEKECPECRGYGRINCPDCFLDDDCINCFGFGSVICPKCNGRGYVRSR
jgi:hypothetical protein